VSTATPTAAPATSAKAENAFRIPATGAWQQAWKVMAVFALLGLVGAGAGFAIAPQRFAFSWLFGFMVALSLGLGAMFFVLVQFLTGSGWSVTVRRTAEFFLTGIFALPVLFIPVALSLDTLYPWIGHTGHGEHATAEHGSGHGGGDHGDEHAAPHGEEAVGEDGIARIGEDHMPIPDSAAWEGNDAALHAQHAEILAFKGWYLNMPFFTGRAIFYFLTWVFLAWRLFSWSTQQDKTRDIAITRKLQGLAPGAIALFAITLTFSGFDWVMALEPTWYSTIYGVYLFAGAVVTIHALVIVIALSLKSQGYLGNTVTTEHFHDLGKMMFGFTVFWTYIGFSQFVLIWYASIPEETTFFHLRWESAGWRAVSLALVVGHFIVPFFMLISRNAKRRLAILGFGAGWMLVMHVIDVYWLVVPYAAPGFSPHWMDIACLFGIVGTFLAIVFWQMSRHSLVAIGDPRIGRAMRFHNA
jgi:hypothetical protein